MTTYARDTFKAIDYLVAPTGGLAYKVVATASTEWTTDGSLGVVFEKDRGQVLDTSGAFIGGERLTHKFNDRVRLVQDADYSPKIDDFSNYVVNAQATLEADLSAKLSATLTLGDTYRNEAAPGRKQNDIRLLAGIKCKF